MKKVLVNVSDNGVITLFDGTIIAKLNPDIKYAALPEYEGKDLHRYAKLKGLFLTFDGIEHQPIQEFTTHYAPYMDTHGTPLSSVREAVLASGETMYFIGAVDINYLSQYEISIGVSTHTVLEEREAARVLETYKTKSTYYPPA